MSRIPSTNVLVVDHFASWRDMVCALLERKGLQVVGQAGNAADAIRKAQELKPDLILLDIRLPDATGIETASQILQRVPDTKIIFVTQTINPAIARAAMADGACGYVLKIDAANELLQAIESALRGEKFISSRLRTTSLNF